MKLRLCDQERGGRTEGCDNEEWVGGQARQVAVRYAEGRWRTRYGGWLEWSRVEKGAAEGGYLLVEKVLELGLFLGELWEGKKVGPVGFLSEKILRRFGFGAKAL